MSFPFRFLKTTDENIKNLFNTYAENKALKKKVADLENQSDLIASLTEENTKLKNEIGASSSTTANVSAIGKVIVRSPVSWYDSLTVKLGKKNNITKGMLVLSGGGLIGKVSDVSQTTSSVRLFSNGSDCNIPIKIKTDSSEIYALLKSYDSNKKCFIITNLNSAIDISKGATVVTSGLDGDTVSNIIVGTVSSVKNGSDSLERIVEVIPKADFSDISYVTIIGE